MQTLQNTEKNNNNGSSQPSRPYPKLTIRATLVTFFPHQQKEMLREIHNIQYV